MTDFYKADKPLRPSKSVEGKPGDAVAVPVERRKVKPPALSPIEEEALRGEGLGLSDLVMPLVDFLTYTKEKRKSLP